MVLIETGTLARHVPTGHLVYWLNTSLVAVPFDAERLTVTPGPVPLVEDVLGGVGIVIPQFSVSEGGSLVHLPSGAAVAERTLVWVDRAGLSTPLAAPSDSYQHPRLSNDGGQVAVETLDGVWVIDVEQGRRTRLAPDGNHPVWTSDGVHVTFASGRDIYWRSADASAESESLWTSDFILRPMSWSPDGETLAFVEVRDGGGDIWVLPRDGEATAFLATPAHEEGAAFSPDGRWLAYTSDETGRAEVYVTEYPGPGAHWPISTAGGMAPLWSASGRELFYRAGAAVMAVDVQTQPAFTAGRPEQLFSGSYVADINGHPRYAVAPNGQRFLMQDPGNQGDAAPAAIILVLNWFEELKARVPIP